MKEDEEDVPTLLYVNSTLYFTAKESSVKLKVWNTL